VKWNRLGESNHITANLYHILRFLLVPVLQQPKIRDSSKKSDLICIINHLSSNRNENPLTRRTLKEFEYSNSDVK
jgi:hypothetical protein